MTKEAKSGELILAHKGGRPTQFKERYTGEIIELMAQGYTNARICATWDISKATFYRWLKEDKKLKEAYDIGEAKSEAWWQELGMAGMVGKIPRFNSSMYGQIVPGKFGQKRKDEPTTQINIENLQVLQSMQQLSDLELDDRIQGLITNLGLTDDTSEGICDAGSEDGTSDSPGREGEEEEV